MMSTKYEPNPQREIRQLKLICDIGKQISSDLKLESVLIKIVQSAIGITNAEVGALMLIGEHSNELRLCAHKTGNETQAILRNELVNDELAYEVIRNNKPLRATSEERVLKVVSGYIVQSVLYVPVHADGEVIGVLSVHNDSRQRAFSEEDERFLIDLTEYAGIAIKNSRCLMEERKQKNQAEVLRKAAIEVSMVSSFDDLGRILLDALAQVVDYQKATVQIIDGEDIDRRLIAYRGFHQEEIDPRLLRPISQDRLVQRVFEGKRPLILTNPATDPDWDSNLPRTENIRSWIGLPLVHNRPLGFITLDHTQVGYYTETLSGLLGVFCSQTAAVIENLNLLRSEHEQKVLADALLDTSVALNTALETGKVLDIILQKVERVVPHQTANIMLTENGIAHITRMKGYKDGETDELAKLEIVVDDYPTFKTMSKARVPLLILDVRKYDGWKDIPSIPSVRSYLGAPICDEKRIIGFLNLNGDQPNYFTHTHSEHLRAFVEQIAVVIRKSQLLEDAQQYAKHLEIVNNISRTLSDKVSSQTLLQAIVDQAATQLNCTHCTLFEYEKDTNELVPMVVSGRVGQSLERRFKPDEGLIGWVYQNGKSVMSSDARQDPRFAPARSNRAYPRSMIVAPIKMGESTIGVICADQDKHGWFDEAGKRLLETLGQQAGVAINRMAGLDLLHKITNEIVGSATKKEEVLRHIVAGAIQLTNTSTGIIYLLDINEDEQRFVVTASFKYPSEFYHPKPRLEDENGLTRTIVRERTHIIIPDIPIPPATHPNLKVNVELKKYYSSMVGIPLLFTGTVWGVLYVHEEKPHKFTENQISLLATLSQLAAIAIRNAHIFETTQTRNNELDVLNRIGQHISSRALLDIEDELLGLVYAQAGTLMDVRNFYIAFWDGVSEHVSFEFVREYGETVDLDNEAYADRKGENGLTEYVARTRQSLLIQSNMENWMTENRIVSIGTLAKTWLGVPMVAGEKTIGVIAVQSYDKEFAFDTQQCEILVTIASQTAIAIENARLYTEVQANQRMLGLLQDASQMLVTHPHQDLRKILQSFVEETRKAARARWIGIVLISSEGQIEDLVSTESDQEESQPREKGNSIAIWRTCQPLVIPDTLDYEAEIPLHPLAKQLQVRAVLGLPWMAKNDKAGVVWLYYDEPHNISHFELDRLQMHFNQAAFIYQSSEKIKEQYRHRELVLSQLAHEIGIPMVGLAGAANAIKEEAGGLGSKEMEDMATVLIEQCQKLELLTHTILLTFGRDDKPISFTRHSIYRPIIDACTLYGRAARNKGCEIRTPKAHNGSFPVMEISLHHLVLAFQNLIDNAVKYSYYPKPGMNVERYITIAGDWANEDQLHYMIKIRNYGVGIDDDEIESGRIYVPFERGKYSGDRSRPGQGLGLALIRYVVEELHHGKFDIESVQVPGGAYLTTAIVRLPVKQPKLPVGVEIEQGNVVSSLKAKDM